MTIGVAVPEICSQTDRHTDWRTDRNTLLCYCAGVVMKMAKKFSTSESHQQICQLSVDVDCPGSMLWHCGRCYLRMRLFCFL